MITPECTAFMCKTHRDVPGRQAAACSKLASSGSEATSTKAKGFRVKFLHYSIGEGIAATRAFAQLVIVCLLVAN